MNKIQFDDQLVADLFDAQPQPVFWMKPVKDSKGTIIDFIYIYCNEEMLRFCNRTSEELIGVSVTDTTTLPEQIKKGVFEQILEVYLTGKKFVDTIYNEKLNKYYSFIRTRVQEGVLTVIQDRSEEYKMIRELEQRKTLLDNILTYSPSGISVSEFIRNEKGEIIDARTSLANEAAIQFSGIPREDYLHKTAKEYYPEILDTPLYQQALETLETGAPFRTQYYLELTGKWLELSVSRLDKDHLINVFSDITESKSVALIKEAKAQHMNVVFNASQAGMFTLLPVYDDKNEIIDFRFQIVNEAVAGYIGQTASVLTGALASIYFPAYKTNGLFEIYKDTYVTGTVHDFDIHYEDGYDVYFHIHTVKSEDAVLVTFTDQTALKKLQAELESTIEELRRSNVNLEEFAYAASHDLKEPIRKIHFFADRLKKQYHDLLDEEGRHTFDRMETATERMRSLVDDLLSYSQVSLRPRSFESVDLNHLLKQVTGDLELEIEEKHAKITVSELPTVKGHMRQLQQLFQNIISNALKYVRQGVIPEIRVDCQTVNGKDSGFDLHGPDESKNYYLIRISDNGIGFDQKDAERIFNVFQRLHGNAEYRGTGIGLSIA
ncbi:MAG TPA: ATP-binding protein, partial [Flavisolibacter sp.]|nr:ATP-binding protein [Flavisolibacter sp.]